MQNEGTAFQGRRRCMASCFRVRSRRGALLLIFGDKSGVSEKRFYKTLIRKADERFGRHLHSLRMNQHHAEVIDSGHEETSSRAAAESGAACTRVDPGAPDFAATAQGAEPHAAINGRASRPEAGQRIKVEKRTDMLISTLRSYIEAMGGSLELIARLPGRGAVKLKGSGDLNTSTWMHKALEQMRCAFIRILRIPPREYRNRLANSV